MKKETNLSPKGFFILVSLLVFSILTPSEYVDCQKLSPDEASDFFGISKVSQKECPPLDSFVLTAVPSGGRHPFLFMQSKAFTSQAINSKTGLAAFIRC